MATKPDNTDLDTEATTTEEVADFDETSLGFDSDIAPADEWDRVEVEMGEKIEWEPGMIFTGTYRGMGEREVTAEQSADGKAGIAKYHRFLDAQSDDRFAWSTANLDPALEGLDGRMVRIVYLGKKDIGHGQTVNRFKLFVKKTPVV